MSACGCVVGPDLSELAMPTATRCCLCVLPVLLLHCARAVVDADADDDAEAAVQFVIDIDADSAVQ